MKRLLFASLLLLPALTSAADITLPGVQISLDDHAAQGTDLAVALKILLGLTVLSRAPAILITATSFTRIILVLSMLRHALGMQQTPPNTVLISLALFLTMFSMMPVIEKVDDTAYTPYVAGKLTAAQAFDRGIVP